MSELIERALRQASHTKIALVGPGVIAQTASAFRQLFGDSAALVIGDERTMQVAGNQVIDVLTAAGIEVGEPYVFPADPELYAKYENCEVLRDALAERPGIPIAVGAGTLNDIVKRAAWELERPYAQVSTAASMDGYTAFGGSIAFQGFKNTMECVAPALSISDTDVIAAAPLAMTASGYGDLLGKVPAGADWMIADALGVEAIDTFSWDLVQQPLMASLAAPEALAAGDKAASDALSEGLIMSGLAMQAHKSSRPASGAEHQFSHVWEMEGHGVDMQPRRLSHGFKVSVGSVAVCALYEAFLKLDIENFDTESAVAAWRSREAMEAYVRELHPDPRLIDETLKQQMAKWITADQLRDRIELLKRSWPELKPRLSNQLLTASEVQVRLRAVGAPAHPSDIELDWERFKQTYRRAGMIRKRYTVLDTLLELGILDDLVEGLFAPDGFWGRQKP